MDWRIGFRTGDSTSGERQALRRDPPEALVTTPESMSLLLSHPDLQRAFRACTVAVVDEWHELLGSKRGVQTELCLARLQHLNPALQIWGLSATLAVPEHALEVLTSAADTAVRLITAPRERDPEIVTLLPDSMDRFPWRGHLGLNRLPDLLPWLERAGTNLLFVNTRSQAERWHQALLEARPDWQDRIALHHGSMAMHLRQGIEDGLRSGRWKVVVATSSLDLGVDFSPVEQVIQIGSPRGVARLLQRAGRSGHAPGQRSRVVCVPAHALECIEFAAARRAIRARHIEQRTPLRQPLDVLIQHLCTLALGGGFRRETVLNELRRTHAYRDLSGADLDWILDFLTSGGPVLKAYPDYQRLTCADGRFVLEGRRRAQLHRMNIGTITDDGSLRVKYLGGATLGTVEERFLARLRPGDHFNFAGKTLRLFHVRDMTAYVRRASGPAKAPVWMGGRMPLSSELADEVLACIEDAEKGVFAGPELRAVRPLLELQSRRSALPGRGRLVVERTRSREGWHLFVYTLAGRPANEGLALLTASRLAAGRPASFRTFATDMGYELLGPEPVEEAGFRAACSLQDLERDLHACLNVSDLAERRFRDIAIIGGLMPARKPSRAQPEMRYLQASGSLLYQVFERYDPENPLRLQALREVMEKELQVDRIRAVLRQVEQAELCWCSPKQLTPFAFPIWAERTHHSLSTETWEARVRRAARALERSA
jgi:ATP-dependent Lhr-like helicase